MIAIVADSSVYMTKKEAQMLGVSIVPLTFTANGHIYNETYMDCNGDFQNLIFWNSMQCQTAGSSIASFMSTFNDLLSDGLEVLCLTISSRLSGTYSSAMIAAKEVNQDKIKVIDSRSTAGGLYLLVKEARAMAIAGMNIQEIAAQLEKKREKIAIAFSVDDMAPLRNSGRLGIVRQSVGTILNIKPLLSCVDGAVVADGIARGRYDQIQKLVGKIPQNAAAIIVHYIKNSEFVDAMMKEVRRLHPNAKIEKRPLGPVLSIHLGLSTVGVVWQEQ